MPERALVIGVVGGSGSGKTSVVRAIQEAAGLDSALLDQDAYYHDLSHLTLEERKRLNFDHPDAFDTALFAEHLERLASRMPVDKPIYDFAAFTRSDRTVRIEPHELVLADGILLFADPRLRPLFDIKVFVDVADDVRFIRRLLRDVSERGRTVESVITQYLETVRPMHLEFIEPSRRHADIIIPEGGQNQVGIEMIRAHIRHELERRHARSAAGR